MLYRVQRPEMVFFKNWKSGQLALKTEVKRTRKSKTKCLSLTRNNGIEKLIFRGVDIKRVRYFWYLGSVD